MIDSEKNEEALKRNEENKKALEQAQQARAQGENAKTANETAKPAGPQGETEKKEGFFSWLGKAIDKFREKVQTFVKEFLEHPFETIGKVHYRHIELAARAALHEQYFVIVGNVHQLTQVLFGMVENTHKHVRTVTHGHH